MRIRGLPRTLLLGALLAACTTTGDPRARAASPAEPPRSATPPASSPDSPATSLADVVGKVREQYVDGVPAARLAAGAFRGLESIAPPGTIRVGESPQSVTLDGDSRSGNIALSVPWLPDPTPDQVGQVLENAGRFAVQRLGVRPSEVVDAMLRGLMAFDTDGYYRTAKEYADLRNPDMGGDVGIAVQIRGEALVVAYPIVGSPGHRVGLRAGDRILTIDGVSTNALKIGEVDRLLRGKSGSGAVLTVARKDWSDPREVAVTRAPVRALGVERRTLGRIGYVWVPVFREETAGQVRTAVDTLRAEGARAIVLDLRSNAGGLLTAAVEVSELFLAPGQLVTYTEGRARRQNMRFSAHAPHPMLDLPLAVLVDDGTAAGAEIVASALQDWARATVVGTKTAGRTTIQTIIPLAHGGVLRLTTARWFTPKGRSLARGGGLTPDVEVMGRDDDERFAGDPRRDAQLRRAVEVVEAKAAP